MSTTADLTTEALSELLLLRSLAGRRDDAGDVLDAARRALACAIRDARVEGLSATAVADLLGGWEPESVAVAVAHAEEVCPPYAGPIGRPRRHRRRLRQALAAAVRAEASFDGLSMTMIEAMVRARAGGAPVREIAEAVGTSDTDVAEVLAQRAARTSTAPPPPPPPADTLDMTPEPAVLDAEDRARVRRNRRILIRAGIGAVVLIGAVTGWLGTRDSDVHVEPAPGLSGPAAEARQVVIDFATAVGDGHGERACALMTAGAASGFAGDSPSCEEAIDGTAGEWADVTVGGARQVDATTVFVTAGEEGDDKPAVTLAVIAYGNGWRIDGRA